MLLFEYLRRPDSKPPYIAHLDKRQDDVEKRLNNVMSVEEANHAQRVIQARR